MIGMMRYDTVWYGMMHYDTVWYGLIGYDTVWYGMMRYDAVYKRYRVFGLSSAEDKHIYWNPIIQINGKRISMAGDWWKP